MLVIDDLLTAPFRGLLWIFKEVAEAAEKEQEAEGDQIRDRLRDLYMLLETGQITEDEFDEEEGELLDRLDEIEEAEGRGEAIVVRDEDDEDDEDDADDADDADDEDDESVGHDGGGGVDADDEDDDVGTAGGGGDGGG
jgi:hypothetical protein